MKPYVDSVKDKKSVEEFDQTNKQQDFKVRDYASEISIQLIDSLINDLKTHKASGHEEICAEHLKLCHPAMGVFMRVLDLGLSYQSSLMSPDATSSEGLLYFKIVSNLR